MAMSDQEGARAAENSGQAAGEHRARFAELWDAEVRPHNERFRAAAAVGPRDRVLDVGCGTGQATREAARAASNGCGTLSIYSHGCRTHSGRFRVGAAPIRIGAGRAGRR
jgi:SAM-dependent methyltransferase